MGVICSPSNVCKSNLFMVGDISWLNLKKKGNTFKKYKLFLDTTMDV